MNRVVLVEKSFAIYIFGYFYGEAFILNIIMIIYLFYVITHRRVYDTIDLSSDRIANAPPAS